MVKSVYSYKTRAGTFGVRILEEKRFLSFPDCLLLLWRPINLIFFCRLKISTVITGEMYYLNA
jgi:hypothetical protein